MDANRKTKKPVKKTVIVTGADRGIGFETCRQLGKMGYIVFLTSPNLKRSKTSALKLSKEGIDVTFQVVDVTDVKQIKDFKTFVTSNYGYVDVLINNAGVLFDEGRSRPEGRIAEIVKKLPQKVCVGEGPSIINIDINIVRATLEVNTLGPLLMCQAFVPLMIKRGTGRVVNVSSSRGQLNSMGDDGAPAYQLSKAALNAVTLMVADAVKFYNIAVNSVCPGWTRTDIGGPEAPQSTDEAVKTIIWLATQPDKGPTGKFFRNKQEIEW